MNNRFSWANQLREQGYVELRPLPGRWASTVRVDVEGLRVWRRQRRPVSWGDVADIAPVWQHPSRVEIGLVRGPDLVIRTDRLGVDGVELAGWLRRETWSRAPIESPPRLVLGSDEELGPVYQKRSGHFVDLDRLGLPPDLVAAVRDWDRRTFANLAHWEIAQDESVRRWEQELLPEGRTLADRIATELGPGATVEMHDDL